MFKKVDPKVSFPKLEEEILTYWEENKIFEQSVAKDAPAGDFVFYEGPPTANGKPGLHHVLARSFKDVIPRYKTMKGYRVARKAGWDTHGLPVELQVEKALGLKNKQEIENIVPGDVRASVIEFNKRCKESVWEYRDLWEKLTKRMGYWVDMEHPYVTYENEYIESVWWQLARIAELKNEKGESFLYRGHKVVPYCYRCGTALSSHEVAQGYQTVKDNSVYVKFKVKPGQKVGEFTTDEDTYFLAWTTTPWTLPGNVALAVNSKTEYVILEKKDEGSGPLVRFILAKERVTAVFGTEGYEIVSTVSGNELVGKKYQPLYDTVGGDTGKSYRVVAGGFVTTDSGTGIVHIAPAFGEDDANVGRENGLPTLLTVETDGTLKLGLGLPGEGVPVKKKNDKNRYAVDDLIIEDLKSRGMLFKEEIYEHEYPFCWRCDTPLIYFAKPSWFIRMSAVCDELVANNQDIGWVPEHIREGRFGEWLSGIRDWAISRDRYWGTPLPIWECEKCQGRKIFSSIGEIEKLSGKTLDDVHKPYIDDVTWLCDCGGMMRRTPEVLDVWFDSGAMPLAQWSYPHGVTKEDKVAIEAGKYFPADYICEAIDQTRGWFYTLHAIATLLNKAGVVKEGRAYKNVICLGHVLDAQGKKMSKSKGNVIDPFQMFEEYGADPLRWLLFSINQPGLPKRFDVKGMRDVQNRVFRMLWNSYSFFTTYATIDQWQPTINSKPSVNLLDRWILSELQILVKSVDESLSAYDVYGPTERIEVFIDNLSNWYIRRSRKRFWKPARMMESGGTEDDADKEQAYQTLYDVLLTLSKLMAPFTPFLAEEMYRNLVSSPAPLAKGSSRIREPRLQRCSTAGRGEGLEEKSISVHLADWPIANELLIDEKLNEEMGSVRELVTEGLKLRAEAKVKVRQPLASLKIQKKISNRADEYDEILKEELNAKEVSIDASIEASIALDTMITPELKLEGEAREIIRAIQEGRKKAKFNVEDRIVFGYNGKERVFQGDAEKGLKGFEEEIAKEVLATVVTEGTFSDADFSETVLLDGEPFVFTLKRN